MNQVKRKRDPEATRARILDAAATLLVSGDGVLEMAWVAKAAEVSQGLAYHHFGSKEGLLTAVVETFYDRLEAQVLMARFDDIESWHERERQRIERYVAFLAVDPLAPVLLGRLASSPSIAAVEAERWRRLVDEGARNMADGQRRGSVDPEQDRELLAAMVLGAARAAVQRMLLSGKRIRPRVLGEQIWQFIHPALAVTQESKA